MKKNIFVLRKSWNKIKKIKIALDFEQLTRTAQETGKGIPIFYLGNYKIFLMSAVRKLPNLEGYLLSFCHTLEKFWLNFKSEKCGNFYKCILTRFFSSLQTAGILALETRAPGPFKLHPTTKNSDPHKKVWRIQNKTRNRRPLYHFVSYYHFQSP